MTGTGIGFGKGQFIMDVGMVVTECPAAYSTGSPRLLFTEPAFHGVFSIGVLMLFQVKAVNPVKPDEWRIRSNNL